MDTTKLGSRALRDTTIWKTAWLLTVALPQMLNNQMAENTSSTAFACALVVVVYAVVPWGYVVRAYFFRGAKND